MYDQKCCPARVLRGLSVVLLLFALAPAAGLAGDDRPATGQWLTDFERAQAATRQLNRPLLVHFHADWCLPCQRMQREALSDPELLNRLGRRVVGVKVNFDDRKDLARRFGVRTLPHDIVLAPDGTLLGKTSGYQPREKYLASLAAANRRFLNHLPADRSLADSESPIRSDRRVPDARPVIVPRPAPGGRQRPVSSRQLLTVTVPRPLVGLDGYNPVALYQHRQWMKGSDRFAAVYKGISYHMNSKAEVRTFLAAPERFAPRLLGCDPVVLQETDRALGGSTDHAAYFDDRLYLFVSAATRRKFKERPQHYTQTRHVLRLETVPNKRTAER